MCYYIYNQNGFVQNGCYKLIIPHPAPADNANSKKIHITGVHIKSAKTRRRDKRLTSVGVFSRPWQAAQPELLTVQQKPDGW